MCGAVLVAKTNMHEPGAGTNGINPHYGATTNPYNTSRISGGSSSGSAAAVSAGLCPVALGVHGGGSVRMPAALCGVVGFKPTFGRVGSVGILAPTIEDTLIVYAAISGKAPLTHLNGLEVESKLSELKNSCKNYKLKNVQRDPTAVNSCRKSLSWFIDDDSLLPSWPSPSSLVTFFFPLPLFIFFILISLS